MNKKEIFISILVVALSIIFAVVSLAVFLSKGKSAKWIKRKMRIGAILLTLNAYASGTAQEIEHTCYDIAEENIMALQNNQTELVISKESERKIKAYIDYRTGEAYSFAIVDAKGNKLQTGTIKPSDGQFDKWKEDFEIKIKDDLKTGRYFLLLFDVPVETQDNRNERNRIQIDLKR